MHGGYTHTRVGSGTHLVWTVFACTPFAEIFLSSLLHVVSLLHRMCLQSGWVQRLLMMIGYTLPSSEEQLLQCEVTLPQMERVLTPPEADSRNGRRGN